MANRSVAIGNELLTDKWALNWTNKFRPDRDYINQQLATITAAGLLSIIIIKRWGSIMLWISCLRYSVVEKVSYLILLKLDRSW